RGPRGPGAGRAGASSYFQVYGTIEAPSTPGLGHEVAVELVAPGLEPADELVERGGPDDLVELGAVVGDEAHVLDEDVVDQPALAALEEPRLDGDLGALLGDDPRAHDGAVAVHGLADVADLLAAVLVDPRDVAALEQVGEELDELFPLGLVPSLPVPRE